MRCWLFLVAISSRLSDKARLWIARNIFTLFNFLYHLDVSIYSEKLNAKFSTIILSLQIAC